MFRKILTQISTLFSFFFVAVQRQRLPPLISCVFLPALPGPDLVYVLRVSVLRQLFSSSVFVSPILLRRLGISTLLRDVSPLPLIAGMDTSRSLLLYVWYVPMIDHQILSPLVYLSRVSVLILCPVTPSIKW